MHANVYDQDQGLTGRYHNTTQKKISHTSIIIQARGLEYKCSIIGESAEATISEYRHKLDKFCPKKANTKATLIEKARPPAWEPPNYSKSSAAVT